MSENGVTVYCLAYNHEKYIGQCLSSLVNQKVDFPYQVIVHDDASTDGTRAVIEDFAKRYPEILIPIYEEENQHSKKTGIVKNIIAPMVQSKYVAVCEGDDYWSSLEKIQKQYDAMEAHPECGICLHRTKEVTETGEDTGRELPMQVYETGILKAEDLFDSIEPRMFHTSSYFFRGDAWRTYQKDSPSYRKGCVVGDVPMLLYFGSSYATYQINEVLSCYRRGGLSSFSNTRYEVNEQRLLRHHNSIITTYRRFDQETNGAYHWICVRRISKNLYASCAIQADFKELLSRESKDYLKDLPPAKRVSVYIGRFFPKPIKNMYLKHLHEFNQRERMRWTGNGGGST